MFAMKQLAPSLLVIPLALAGGCGAPPAQGGAPSFPETSFLSVTSDHSVAHLALFASPSQPPARGLSDIEYAITDGAGAPLAGLAVAVTPWMPDMGHGSTAPQVEETAPGHYLLRDVSMFMPGRWQLRTTLGGTASDTVTPELDIP